MMVNTGNDYGQTQPVVLMMAAMLFPPPRRSTSVVSASFTGALVELVEQVEGLPVFRPAIGLAVQRGW